MKCFVVAVSIAIGHEGEPVPIMDDEDNVILFDSEEDADNMAREQPLCQAGGYSVFDWSYYIVARAEDYQVECKL